MLHKDVRSVIMSFHNPNERIAGVIQDIVEEASYASLAYLRCGSLSKLLRRASPNFRKIDTMMTDVYVKFRFSYEDNHCSRLSALYWIFNDDE